MSDTLVGVSPPSEPAAAGDAQDRELSPAELAAVQDLVRQARAQGIALTGPDGLLKAMTKTVIEAALEPVSGDDRSTGERWAATAAELGVSRRTLERQIKQLRQRRPAGLVDPRKLRDARRTVDPRWDAACREVLSRYTNRSKPTMQT